MIQKKIHNFHQNQKPLSHKGIIVCWGFFDGAHQGHQALLNQLTTMARENNYEAGIITFDVKPQSVINNVPNQVLLTNEDKYQLIKKTTQIAYYWEIQFNKTIAKTTAQQFIAWLLALNVKAVVVSRHVRFGFQGQGDLKTLQQSSLTVYLCEDVFSENHHKISATYIKALLQAKKINEANLCLQQKPYTVAGKVIHGNKEGSVIGFPTANLELIADYALPGLATYITSSKVDDHWYRSMSVIMMRHNKPLVETYLLDFKDDLYGKIIKVRFLTFLRDNLQFNNLVDLKKQLKTDLANTIAYFKNKAEKS